MGVHELEKVEHWFRTRLVRHEEEERKQRFRFEVRRQYRIKL